MNIRFAVTPTGKAGSDVTAGLAGEDDCEWRDQCGEDADDALPQGKSSVLVSFAFIDAWRKRATNYRHRSWSMDSGAFSAYNSGGVVDLQEYIEACHEFAATDPRLVEVFSLDVLGDPEEGRRNTEKMWEAGVRAIPVWHAGESEELLTHYAKHYPKISLGGAAGLKGKRKLDLAKQVFASVWPCRIHGLAFFSPKDLWALPWHSVDATTWKVGPSKYGMWRGYGRRLGKSSQTQLSARGALNVRVEIEWWQRTERQLRQRWRKQVQLMSELPGEWRCSSWRQQ